MKDEGLRAPGLLCFTPTLPLIPGTRLHNSYVVTDHPQPASLESQPMTQGGGNDLSNPDADAASVIYLCANMAELLRGAHVLYDDSPGSRLRCGAAEACSAGWSWFDISNIVSFSNISPFPSDQISKRASFSLWLYNFYLVWHTVCAKNVQSAGGVGGCSRAASGMVFYAWLLLNGVHTQRRVLGVDVLTRTALWEPQKDEGRRYKMESKDMIFCLGCHFMDFTNFYVQYKIFVWVQGHDEAEQSAYNAVKAQNQIHIYLHNFPICVEDRDGWKKKTFWW